MRYVAVKNCRFFLIVDLAYSLKEEADWTVISAWAVTPAKELLLISRLRERLEGPDIDKQVIRWYRKYSAQFIGVEDVAAQALVVQGWRKKGLTVRALKADKDKLTRSIPAAVRMEAGQIYFPDGAEWLGEFEKELLSFPHGAHDDQVDTLSYAAVEVQRFGGAPEPDHYEDLREYAEKDLAAQLFNQVDNPLFWVSDDEAHDDD